MTGKKSDEVLNMSQRTVLQYLSLTGLEVSQSPSYSGGGIDTEPVSSSWLDRDPR